MKTIATAAIIAILSAPAFAADDKSDQTSNTRKARTSIVLSAKQLDKVTAGQGYFLIKMKPVYISSYQTSGSG